MRGFIFPLTCAVLAISSVPVMAQSASGYDELKGRLRYLENEVDTLNQAVYRGKVPEKAPARAAAPSVNDARALADAQAQIVGLEAEIRELNGHIERQNYKIEQLERKLDRVLSDVDLRIKDIEAARQAGIVGSNAAPASSQGQGAAVKNTTGTNVARPLAAPSQTGLSDGQATEAYNKAFALLKVAKYDEAQSAFQAFLKAHDDHRLATNARYWLGETYYVRGNFNEAVRVFAEAFQKDPKGTKAADNLLKMGLSLSALGQKDDACVALEQVGKEFPLSKNTPIGQRAREEIKRLGC